MPTLTDVVFGVMLLILFAGWVCLMLQRLGKDVEINSKPNWEGE